MSRVAALLVLAAGAAVIGCATGPSRERGSLDGGVRRDASVASDAAVADAGARDAGAPSDAGSPADASAARDAGRAPDAGACPMGRTRCGAVCVDTRSDLAHCGACDRACAPAGATPACVGGSCFIASCEAGRADCNASAADGCEGSCAAGPCTASCGSTGTRDCTSICAPSCTPPAEICNLVDDDCDGMCDESVAGCRVGVHRSVATASPGDHFYTTSRTEAACCGYRVENFDYFRLYAAPASGLVALHRCLLASGTHFYTTSATCEGAAGSIHEGILGYLSPTATCGAVPLYRLVHGSAGHFYTTSAAERDSAVASGFVYESIAGYVFTTP